MNGNLVENSFYSPFGEIIGGGKSTRFDYEAKECDSVVNDVDFHFRKYKPQWGKFTQPDTLIPNVYDPQSLNRYAFERNNFRNTGYTRHIAGQEIGKIKEQLKRNTQQLIQNISDSTTQLWGGNDLEAVIARGGQKIRSCEPPGEIPELNPASDSLISAR